MNLLLSQTALCQKSQWLGSKIYENRTMDMILGQLLQQYRVLIQGDKLITVQFSQHQHMSKYRNGETN